MKKFKQWLIKEGKDIFGFDKQMPDSFPKKDSDTPVNTFNVEFFSNLLAKENIGVLRPNQIFINEVVWGERVPGSLAVYFHSLLNLELCRLVEDLQGNSTWITKKVLQIDRSGVGGSEPGVAQEVLTELNNIYKSPMESPKKECDLEDLVIDVAEKLKRTARDIFIFEGITQVDPNDYIIRFSVRGQGVEAPDHHKVLEHQTRMIFHPDRGFIEGWMYQIESPVGKAPNWDIMPSDISSFFSPLQDSEEIAEALATTLHWW